MSHMRDGKRGLVYLVSGIAAGALAFFWVYPYIDNGMSQEAIGDSPKVLVFQDGSLGEYATSIDVSIDGKEDSAYLKLSELDVSTGTDPRVTIYLSLSRYLPGFAYSHSSLECGVDLPDGGNSEISTVNPQDVWNEAYAQGVASASPTATGEMTAIVLTGMPPIVKIKCPLLAKHRFERISLDSWNLNLPGVEVYAFNGAPRPTVAYWVAREGNEYLQQASQPPSETLENSFAWYQRDYDFLARQGLFLVISSPELQRDGAYRLFLAGALVGLGGGLLVAGIQYLTDRVS